MRIHARDWRRVVFKVIFSLYYQSLRFDLLLMQGV